MKGNDIRGYSWERDGDLRVLRELERCEAEINNLLMSSNLLIQRSAHDMESAVLRKKSLIERRDRLQDWANSLYWHRLLTWATTGRVL